MSTWQKLNRGLEYRNHPTRKHGVRFDRCFRGRYTVDGKTYTVGFGFESEWQGDGTYVDECLRRLLELKANAISGNGPKTIKEERALQIAKKEKEEAERKRKERETITFSEYFKKNYLPIAKTSKGEKTCLEEVSIDKKWLSPFLGKLPVKDIRPFHLEKIKRAMLKEKRSPRRIQYVLAVFRQVWNHATVSRIVSGDWPGRSVKIPKFDNRRMRFLTAKDADELLAEINSRSEQTHNISLLSLDCGLRFGEIVRLKWGHIDVENGLIMVIDPKSIKGVKNRAAFMTSRARSMFERLPKGKKTDLVFKGRKGDRIAKISHSFFRSVDKLKLNEGITDRRDRVVFHTLRHTYASNLVSSGSDLFVVSQLLGHTDVTMAARYSHLGAGSLKSAVERMERAQEKEMEPKTKKQAPKETGVSQV